MTQRGNERKAIGRDDDDFCRFVEALGERVAYKWVTGGALRTSGLWPEGFFIPPRVQGLLIAVGSGLGLLLLALVISWIAQSPSECPSRPRSLSRPGTCLIVAFPTKRSMSSMRPEAGSSSAFFEAASV